MGDKMEGLVGAPLSSLVCFRCLLPTQDFAHLHNVWH